MDRRIDKANNENSYNKVMIICDNSGEFNIQLNNERLEQVEVHKLLEAKVENEESIEEEVNEILTNASHLSQAFISKNEVSKKQR